jgi:hypothetical protein
LKISQHRSLLDYFESDDGELAVKVTSALFALDASERGSEDMMHFRVDSWIRAPLMLLHSKIGLPIRIDRNRTDP